MFDHGLGQTVMTCLTHASRTRSGVSSDKWVSNAQEPARGKGTIARKACKYSIFLLKKWKLFSKRSKTKKEYDDIKDFL